MSDISDSDSESRSIRISKGRRSRHCRRIVFREFVEEHLYRQVVDFSRPHTHDTTWFIFSPYSTTHDTLRSVRMRGRHFHEARVDPGAIPPVTVSNGSNIPDTKNVRESTLPFGKFAIQKNGLQEVCGLARAIAIVKAIYLRVGILLYEMAAPNPHYHNVKDEPDLSRRINECIMPELKELFFFCLIEVNPSPVIFLCTRFTLKRLWENDHPMPHGQLNTCWITHIATVVRLN